MIIISIPPKPYSNYKGLYVTSLVNPILEARQVSISSTAIGSCEDSGW